MKIKYSLLPFVIVCFAMLAMVACKNTQPQPVPRQNEIADEEKMNKQDQMEAAMEYEVERSKDLKLGYIPRQRLLNAFEAVKRNALTQRGALPGITWNERGPSNVGGRTRSILIDKNDPTGNTIWAGSVGGGLWKGSNITTAGYSWSAVDNLFPNLAVSSIAQNPTNLNTLYFGTGEGFFNADAIQGGGIWKSTDDGVTWVHLPSTAVASPSSTFSHIQKIVVKQVAGVEYLFVATRNGGVRLSTNGGTSFSPVIVTGATSSRCSDLEIGANGDIYASMGMNNVSGVPDMDGVYRSTDNGTIWTKCVFPVTGYLRVEIATAPGADSVLYAGLQNSSNSTALGIYKSTNFGTTWTAVNNAGGGTWAASQAWYDMAIAVDPDNPEHVIVGGLDTYVSSNGGTSWTKMSSWSGGSPQFIHADHHYIHFFKGPSKTYLYFGNDGGVFFSADASIAIPPAVGKNNGYNVTQFYHGAIGPAPGSNQYIAGSQDNGTQYFTAAGINSTTAVTGGDGAYCHIDDDNSNIQISQYIYNEYFITNNNWASYSTVKVGSNLGRFINPSDYDSRTNSLYGANSSSNYTLIKDVGGANTSSTKTAAAFGAVVSAIRVSPNTVSRVFFGMSNGRIVRVDNADGTTPVFTNITATVPQVGTVSEIAVQEDDDNHILYCISNYGTTSIWETKNGGTNWINIEGNFTQDVPVRAIMFSPNDPTQAFIGTEIGVYSTELLDGASTNWGETNTGLARVRIDHLEYRKGEGTLLAVTHGRGIYTSTSLERPAVYFGSPLLVTETTTNTTDCRKYTDVVVPVTLSRNPSAPAQVNVSANAALSTATIGQDYEILTPMPMSFSSASTQNVTLRIYDDAATESSEKASIELSINNPAGTNAKRGAAYLNSIVISDNDKLPQAGGTRTLLFSEDWETGAGSWLGFGGETTAAPNVFGIYAVCNNKITNQTALISDRIKFLCGYDNTKATTDVIYRTINAVDKYNLSIEFDWIGVAEVGYDQGEVVFDTTVAPTPTWNVLAGANNLSGKSAITRAIANLPPELNNRSFRIGFRWINDSFEGASPAFAVDNISIYSTLHADIQLPANDATAPINYVGGLQTVHFFDNSGKVIASLKNNNNTILGCVKLSVDRSGGGANVPFWSSDPATYLAAKTYMLTAPDAPASGISYDLTLYYTAAEINTWKAGTGYTENDPKIVKITGRAIGEVTPGNQFASNVTVSPTATKTAFGFGDFTYTSTFTSFSGFGLGVPGVSGGGPLPVTTLNFNGVLENNKAKLTWNTLTESNNKGFHLEKSRDGRTFASIAFIDGNGTSVMPHAYGYNDYDLSRGVFYYRLKQTDRDGRFTYSRIVQLQVDKNGGVHVMPNPFRDRFQLFFGEKADKAEIQLYNASGSKVLSQVLQLNGQTSTSVNINNHLPKGNYLLQVLYNNKRQQVKLIKL